MIFCGEFSKSAAKVSVQAGAGRSSRGAGLLLKNSTGYPQAKMDLLAKLEESKRVRGVLGFSTYSTSLPLN